MSTAYKHDCKQAHKLAWHRKYWLSNAKRALKNNDEFSCFYALLVMVSIETDGEI